MDKITALKSAVLGVTTLEVHDGDAVKTLQLILDYNAIVKAEEAIGRDLSKPKNWVKLSAKDLTTIAWAALDRYHPEITLTEVRRFLVPAQCDQLFQMLMEQCHPGYLDLVEAALAEASKVDEGKTVPSPTTVPA